MSPIPGPSFIVSPLSRAAESPDASRAETSGAAEPGAHSVRRPSPSDLHTPCRVRWCRRTLTVAPLRGTSTCCSGIPEGKAEPSLLAAPLAPHGPQSSMPGAINAHAGLRIPSWAPRHNHDGAHYACNPACNIADAKVRVNRKNHRGPFLHRRSSGFDQKEVWLAAIGFTSVNVHRPTHVNITRSEPAGTRSPAAAL